MIKYLFLVGLLVLVIISGGCGSVRGGTSTPTYFTLSEFACSNGDTFTIEARNNIINIIIPMINQPRSQCPFGWNITSGYRSVAYNQSIHGATNSLHTKGLACDVAVYSTETRYIIIKWSTYYNIPQIVVYVGGWVHLGKLNNNNYIMCVDGFDA